MIKGISQPLLKFDLQTGIFVTVMGI